MKDDDGLVSVTLVSLRIVSCVMATVAVSSASRVARLAARTTRTTTTRRATRAIARSSAAPRKGGGDDIGDGCAGERGGVGAGCDGDAGVEADDERSAEEEAFVER